jgi:anti-sigma regulatory factor (Ser/Thr protein kinase)/putative methionine-R-sulfoxide reductase with GAF domain
MSIPVDDPSTNERLHRIEAVTDTALAHLKVEDLLVELLDRVRELLEVDTAAVLLLDESAQQLVATAARGLEEEVHQGTRIPLGKGFAGRIAAQGIPVIVDRVDHKTVLNPILREKGIRSLLGVPLVVGGAVIGVLHVGALSDRTFGEHDVDLLLLVADRVALAIQSRASEVERAASLALQRSLIPAMLPLLPGLDLAARYVPAEQGGVGGDWYDLFTLPSGWLCVVIGDVVGHGLRAAVVMGRMRSALRAYALDGGDPAEVLAKLDRKVQHFEPGSMATVLCAKIDPSLDRMLISSAGHPAPVLARPGEPAALVALPIDPPLGVRIGLRRRSTEVEMPPSGLLCFYTDGLVERRGRTLDEGLRMLCQTIVAGPADGVCTTVMSRLIGSQPPDDDVALVTVRRRAQTEVAALDLVLPAVPDSLRRIRRAVGRWLSGTHATPAEVADLQLAIGEASSNVVEHAYGPAGGAIAVRLTLSPPDALVTVRDNGSWRPPRGHNRGRGTTVMRRCSDELRIDHNLSGTEVFIRRRLSGTVPEAASEEAASEEAASEEAASEEASEAAP